MENLKLNEAKNKLINQAERVAGAYLLSKFGSAHLMSNPIVELKAVEGPVAHSFAFSGKIICHAEAEMGKGFSKLDINMSINENNIEVESDNIQEKVENTLNSQQELEPVKASLDAFRLVDDGSKYYKVSHPALEDANLGILGKNEYATSPDKSELLQTIVKDAITRVANETTISFTGEFKEPVIEKKADDEDYCPECETPNQFGEVCEKCKRDLENDAMSSQKENQPKKSWLTADIHWDGESDEPSTLNTCESCGADNELGFDACRICHKAPAMTPTMSINENMPKATLSNKLSQDMQLEDQKLASANEKIKTEAVNALVSMLHQYGYGSAKVAEVSMTDSKIDAMVTLDDAGTIKAVNIPVEVKEGKVVLPKRSLIAELISKGLDIQAKLTESFSQEVIEKLAAIEEKIAYEQKEAQDILNERPSVKKEASGYDNTMFLGDQDVLVLNKFLVPGWENMAEGDTLSDGASSWSLVSKNSQQNSKGEDDGSQWSFKKVAPPETDKEPKEQIKI